MDSKIHTRSQQETFWFCGIFSCRTATANRATAHGQGAARRRLSLPLRKEPARVEQPGRDAGQCRGLDHTNREAAPVHADLTPDHRTQLSLSSTTDCSSHYPHRSQLRHKSCPSRSRQVTSRNLRSTKHWRRLRQSVPFATQIHSTRGALGFASAIGVGATSHDQRI
jgi:hypothetical protein